MTIWKRFLALGIVFSAFTLFVNNTAASGLNLTEEEQQWIANQAEVSVAPDANFFPYAFINDAGEFDGISRDYLNEIEKLSGLRFKYQIGLPWLEMLEGLDQGRFDIIPMMFRDPEKDSFTNFSTPYLLHTEYLFTLDDSPIVDSIERANGKTIAVVEGYEQTHWLIQRYPNIQLKYYEEPVHCLRAVANGEVYGTIGELSSTLYLKNKLRLTNIKKNTVVSGRKDIAISMGIGKQSSLLLSIINKAINHIDIETRNRISGQWLTNSASQRILNGVFGYGRAPYMYDQSSEVGLEYEVTRQVLSSIGYQIENVEQLPTFRGQSILNEDQTLDFSAGVYEQQDGFFYSDDIVEFSNVAVTRKSDNFAINTPSQLSNYTVTSFSGVKKLYAKEFGGEVLGSSRFKEQTIQELSLSEFFSGNAEVLIAGEELVKWTIRHSGMTNSMIDDYTFHRIFDNPNVGYKVAFRDERLRDLFNHALRQLKQSDSYEQLVQLYLQSNFNHKIKRANLIADVVAPYIFHNDIKKLRSILRVFHKGSNIKAISVSSDSPRKVILQLQEIDGKLKTVDAIQVSHMTRLSKESFFMQNGSTDKVGSIIFYGLANTPEQIISAHVPDLRQFTDLNGPELANMRLTYERHELSGQLLNLSDAEQQWIKQNPNINIAVDPAALPYEAFDNDGEYIGIIADYLQLISASTGIVFTPVKVDSWAQSLTLIHQRKVMLASAAFGNSHLELDYITTLPITKSEVSYAGLTKRGFIRSLNELRGKKVGIIKGASQTESLVEQSPDIEWVYPETTEQGIEQVADGDIDGMIDTILVLNYMIQTRGYSNLAVTGDFDKNVASTLYVLKSQPLLQSIVSKAIDAITQQQKNAIISKWVPNKVIEKIDYTLLWQVIIVAVALVLFAIYWNRRLATHIKAREQAELKLKAREQLLFDMLNSAPISVAIVARNQVFFTNKTAREMFGVAAEELDNFDVSEIYRDPAQPEACYQKLLNGETVVNQEIDFKSTDGRHFTGLANYFNTEFNDRSAILFWCYDISELKDLNNQLSQATEDADNANQAKSDFLANMSHEIRTPMNAIIGMTHLALTAELDRKTRSYLNKVSHAAASLLGIINDILDFSKIEAGKLTMECLDISINDILQNQLNLIELKAQDKGVEVLTLIEPAVPNNLMGDPLRLGQIFTNLASNAIKFTDHGEIVFSVALIKQSEQQVKLQFSVKDSGIGISPEQQQKLFQSFTQADASTTRQYGGTGLGLTICKSLVELMNGEIWLESTLGKGTEFIFTAWFYLNPDRPRLRSSVNADSLNGMTILVVDDNESAADIMASIVSSFGPSVKIAHSGAEAITLVSAEPELFDIAMVDWSMPDMDGIATCEALRQEAGSHPINFIMVSAYDHARFKSRSEEAGVGSYLAKPITASAVFNELVRISGRDIALYTPLSTISDQLSQAKDKLAGAHVLLVEDNELNQDLALELLTSIGISCELAENGQIAVDMLQQNHYDGVLMDIQMPVLDGYSATQKIREFNKDIVIIAMTANAMSGDREKVISAGMNDYISKPIDVDLMITTLAKWVSASGLKHKHKLSVSTDDVTLGELKNLDTVFIDQQAGLATCNGNASLYKKMLSKFAVNQQFFVSQFEQAAGEFDWELATRLAHTLKGNAGNIGAITLQACAGTLEAIAESIAPGQPGERFENSNERIQTVVGELATHLADVLNEIDALLPQSKDNDLLANKYQQGAESDSHIESNLQALTAAVAELAIQLEEYDADAVDLIERLAELTYPKAIQQQLAKMNKAAAEYDFETATEQLNELQNLLN